MILISLLGNAAYQFKLIYHNMLTVASSEVLVRYLGALSYNTNIPTREVSFPTKIMYHNTSTVGSSEVSDRHLAAVSSNTDITLRICPYPSKLIYHNMLTVVSSEIAKWHLEAPSKSTDTTSREYPQLKKKSKNWSILFNKEMQYQYFPAFLNELYSRPLWQEYSFRTSFSSGILCS